MPEVPNPIILRALIGGDNPTPLSVGDNIGMSNGIANSVYSEIRSSYIGEDVVLPVVNGESSIIMPVYGFIGFHITDSVSDFRGHYVELFLR